LVGAVKRGEVSGQANKEVSFHTEFAEFTQRSRRRFLLALRVGAGWRHGWRWLGSLSREGYSCGVTAQLCAARWLSMAVKQGRRIHHRDTETQRHRDTKKKPGDDFSRTYRLRFSFSDPLCLCASVVNPTCLLEPVRSRPHLIKQIMPCGGDGRDTPATTELTARAVCQQRGPLVSGQPPTGASSYQTGDEQLHYFNF
jgi:hypothetical protein